MRPGARIEDLSWIKEHVFQKALSNMDSLETRQLDEFIAAWEDCRETTMLDSIAQSETTLSENGDVVTLKWHVNARYARFLYVFVKLFQPKRILEVGMANGISSAYMATAQNTYLKQKDAHVIIDPFQSTQWSRAGIALLRRLNLHENTRVIEDYSYRAIPQLDREGERFDMAFIDGSHCLDYTLTDVLTSDRVLEIGGLLLLDDSSAFGVKYAVKYLDRYRHNLKRIRFDNPVLHALREVTNKRRRITVYQKIADDDRGPDGT
jgi:predicted O-methyltransferase YrrM